ncbi:DUF1129 family protein [Viridibacillus sp. YIM B01967]|uniref:DUF1129 family protein n=1 Tax=Viridibacillus soli TaxID=2798301 RepID=A0ABS1HCS4_9BACL|nr:DUF1129 family protein [Viridibacillus soli]MBK3497251.1 DUF1129 family protein [Viridibacillus soli]
MVIVKKIIAENNKKRKLLTKENQAYFDKLLVYVRAHVLLSERQSEEVLMEMLDHLLIAEEEGKTAVDVFGPNPKAYADDIVDALPKEKKGSLMTFGVEILCDLMGWFIIIGAVGRYFTKSDQIYLYSAIINVVALVAIGGGLLYLILQQLKKGAFEEKMSTSAIIKAGLVGTGTFGLFMGILYFTDKLGPLVNITWFAQLGAGSALLLISYLMKRDRTKRY